MNCKMDFPQKISEYQWNYDYKYSTVYKILSTVLQKLISTLCLVCRFVGVHLMSLIMSHFAIYTLTACSLLMIKTSTTKVSLVGMTEPKACDWLNKGALFEYHWTENLVFSLIN